MDIQILEDVGLTKVQSVAYKTLVDNGALSAPALAATIGESRTNGYKVLDKLVEFGLAVKEPRGGKFVYAATSPTALEQFVKLQAEKIRQRERRLNTELPHLLDYYFAHSERPSIRYFEGAEGLAQINRDQLSTGKPMQFIRSKADANFLGFEGLHKLRNNFPRLGIQREVIIPDDLVYELPEDNRMLVAESDKAMLLKRTWLNPGDYTAPVEWSVYGDKLSIISYGEEAMGMVIVSAPIATAFRQIFALLDEGIRRRPEYSRLPLHMTYTAIPESLKNKK